MSISTFFLLQLLALANSASHSRYNNRAFKTLHLPTHAAIKQPQDCFFDICENAPHYPEKAVEFIVSKHRSFHSFLKGKVIEPSPAVTIFSRYNEQLQSFCETVDIVAAPKLMLDVDKVWRNVVNLRNYSQILEYQACRHADGAECFMETILDIKTKCVQMFNNVKLVTFDANNKALEYRTFRIPSTCVCTYTKQFS